MFDTDLIIPMYEIYFTRDKHSERRVRDEGVSDWLGSGLKIVRSLGRNGDDDEDFVENVAE